MSPLMRGYMLGIIFRRWRGDVLAEQTQKYPWD